MFHVIYCFSSISQSSGSTGVSSGNWRRGSLSVCSVKERVLVALNDFFQVRSGGPNKSGNICFSRTDIVIITNILKMQIIFNIETCYEDDCALVKEYYSENLVMTDIDSTCTKTRCAREVP